MKTKRQSLFVAAGFVLIGLFAVSINAQTVRRVKFPKNVKTVVFRDSANRKQTDTYIFRLKKGERAEADVTWRGENINVANEDVLSGLSIKYPGGRLLEDVQDGIINAARNGDYKVFVTPRHRKTNYRYKIIITKLD